MKKRLKTIAVLTLLGTPSNILCFIWHICVCGHKQHGPYPSYQTVSDIFWVACFSAVFTFSFRLRAKRKMWFLYGSLLLLLLRIPLSSGGGISIILELPMLIVMDFFAIKYLTKPEKYIAVGEPNTTADGDE
jgi:hypothetical protein